MKKLYVILTSIIMAAAGYAQTNIQIEISNLKSDQGSVMLELLDVNKELVADKKGVIENGICQISFTNLPTGKYAIRYYHDENSNEKLDTNLIGIPKEGYGFSNDAYGQYGPKDFAEWLFSATGETKITLRTAYL